MSENIMSDINTTEKMTSWIGQKKVDRYCMQEVYGRKSPVYLKIKRGDGHSVVGYGIGLSLTDFFDHCDCNQDGGQRTGIFQPDKSWKGHEAFQDIQIPEYAR